MSNRQAERHITLMPSIQGGSGQGQLKVSRALFIPILNFKLIIMLTSQFVSIDLYDVNVGLHLSRAPGQKFFAIGDLNNDKQNDIITVSEDQTSFSAHYFKQDAGYKFSSGANDSTPAAPTVMPVGYKIT